MLTVCDQAGIAVPDDVAVLGIDNDEMQCEACTPALSSVDPDAARTGYEAAALLDRMLRGEPPPRARLFGTPRGVVARRSTDVLAVADRDVAAAVRFVREQACDPDLEMQDVVDHLCVSRSTLDRWFLKWLGRTANEEIDRVQLARVKELLATTDLSLEKIAPRCGFEHLESLCRSVKRITGQTPGEYRKANMRK